MDVVRSNLMYQLGFLLVLLSIGMSAKSATLNRGFGIPLSVDNLDPHGNSSDAIYSVITHYLSPLLTVDEEGNLVPALAESWNVSDDGKRITLILRDNLVWSDGTPLTALQAKQSIERALSDTSFSDAAPLLMPIVGAEEYLQHKNHDIKLGVSALSDKILQFDLVLPSPTFLQALTHPISSPVPIHQINDNNEYPTIQNIASSGPYKIVARNKSQVFFEVNDNYFGEKPIYDKVTFTFGKYGELVRDFLKGEMQILDWVSAEDAKWFKKKNPNLLKNNKTLGAVFLSFNEFSIKDEVRRILYNSINVNDIKNKVSNDETFTPLQRIFSWEKDKTIVPLIDFNIEQSKLEMEAMGYTSDSPLALCINILNTPLNIKLLNYLKSYWAAININLEMHDRFIGSKEGSVRCDIVHDGYTPRVKSVEEVISMFFVGNTFGKSIKDNKYLNLLYQDLLSESDMERRRDKVFFIESELLRRNLIKPINSIEFLSLVAEEVGGFESARKSFLIALSQFLYPKQGSEKNEKRL